MRRIQIAILLLLSLAVVACEPASSQPTVDLQDRLGSVKVLRVDDHVQLEVETSAGPLRVTPDEFAEMIGRARESQVRHGWLFVLLNITSWFDMLWVAVGLIGQSLFMGRMILQWVASEKHKRSIVPVGFWWGSLFGGAMLLTYFIWRKDVVGVLGQSTGVFIYARNLILIYRHAQPMSVTTPPATDSGKA